MKSFSSRNNSDASRSRDGISYDPTAPSCIIEDIFHHIDGWSYCKHGITIHYIRDKNAYWISQLLVPDQMEIYLMLYKAALEPHYAAYYPLSLVDVINIFGPLWLEPQLVAKPCYLYRTGMMKIQGAEDLVLHPLSEAGRSLLDPEISPFTLQHDLPYDHAWLRELSYHRGIFRVGQKKPVFRYPLIDPHVHEALQILAAWLSDDPGKCFDYETLKKHKPWEVNPHWFLRGTLGRPYPPLLIGHLVLWCKLTEQYPSLESYVGSSIHPGPAALTSIAYFNYTKGGIGGANAGIQLRARLLVHLLTQEIQATPDEIKQLLTTLPLDDAIQKMALRFF